MRAVLRATALLLLAGLTVGISAGPVPTFVILSFVPPTAYTDGTPLLEQDLDYYTLSCDGTPLLTIDNVIGTYETTVDLSVLSAGDHTCSMTVTDLNGMVSAESNSVSFTLGQRSPNPPTLTIRIL